MIYHAYTVYTPKDPDTVRRNDLAQLTWINQSWIEIPVSDSILPRLWKEDGRQFPYIKDLFDFACKDKDGRDIIIYTNSDIHCAPHCSSMVALVLGQADACYAYRKDFVRLDAPIKTEDYKKGNAYCGSDLCGFRVDWWYRNRSVMPDMILALEAWDPIWRHLVDMTNSNRMVSIPDIIGHERHGSYWEDPRNRYRLKGQRLCRKLASDWLLKYGFNPKTHGL